MQNAVILLIPTPVTASTRELFPAICDHCDQMNELLQSRCGGMKYLTVRL